MSNAFEVCFSTTPKATLPVDVNNKKAYRRFRKDNPHILGTFIPAGTPFILSDSSSNTLEKIKNERPDIACALDTVKSWSQETKRNVAHLSSEFGDENLQAIAHLYEKEIKPFLDATNHIMGGKIDEYTAVGAAATAINEKQVRLSEFGKALLKYQNTLLNLRAASRSGIQKKELVKLGFKVKEAHSSLNEKFTKELAHYAGRVKSSKGNIWNNPERGLNIAKSGRNSTKLQLTSLANIRSVRALEVGSDVIGKKIIAIDAGVRFNNIRNAKSNGEDWQKRMVKEVAGFGASNAAGAWTTAKVVTTGMGIALAAGPLGVVVLIGVGLGAGYAAAKMGDWLGQGLAEKTYETSSKINWF